MASDDITEQLRRRSSDVSRAFELPQIGLFHWSPSPVNTPGTGYAPVHEDRDSESDTEPLKSERHTSYPRRSLEPRLWTIAVQLFAFLWLVPIITLLVLNIKRHVLGASAWCPGGHCFPAVYSENEEVHAAELPAKYDKQTHNLVGGLQFVAKALEVWFIMIASWLVYLATISLATRSSGLPIGYISMPSEFDKIPAIVDLRMWKTLKRLSVSGVKSPPVGWRIWLFVISTVFLCAICNLMGPAVAVLVIPTLQWINTDKHVQERFLGMNSAQPPSSDGFAYWDTDGCDDDDFSVRDYSCAMDWQASMNAWVEGYGASQNSGNVVSIQDRVSFTYNGTREPVRSTANNTFDYVIWTPSRQILHDLSADLDNVKLLSSNENEYETNDTALTSVVDTYAEYNNTVQTLIRRNGPILGALSNVWLGFDEQIYWTTEVDPDRLIRCYAGYNVSNVPTCWDECGTGDLIPVSGNYTRCIPIGTGWQDGYKTTNFSINSFRTDDDYWPEIEVTVHASSKAGFLPNDASPQSFLDECLPRNASISSETFDKCDWDLLWDSTSKPNVTHRSTTVNTIEMFWDTTELSNGTASSTMVAVDFVVYQSFANYTLDPSILTNPLYTVEWAVDPRDNATLDNPNILPVDPTWTLVAWTTEADGHISTEQSITSRLRNVFGTMRNEHNDGLTVPEVIWQNHGRLAKVGLMPIIQTLSLIEHNTTNATATDSNTDPRQPLLYRYGRINVYAFGLSSRTSWVGVIVTSLGCVVVLAEIVLALWDRRRFRSLTQLLVAALEHRYENEFPEVIHDQEKRIARVPFRLYEVERGAGKLRFERRG